MKKRSNASYLKELYLLRNNVASFEKYPFSLPVVRNLDSLKLHPKVTFFVGENGSGKSTLLEAIAAVWGFNPEGGSRNFRFSTRESHSELHDFLRLSKSHTRPKDGFFLRAESFFNVATEIENLDGGNTSGPLISEAYGGTSLHEQSHGEAFFALLMHRFFGQGFYILDEPEAALSPMRQMAMLSRIHDLVEDNSQFIIATHSPIIMAYPNAQIYVISDKGITATPYTETEHYRVTKDFLNKPEKMLSILMD